jgi:hypothetical protein
MKRVLDFLMNNKYFIIAFSALVFGLKFVFDKYNLPARYLPVLAILETVFQLVFITCLVHVFSVFVLAFVLKNKSEPWWEKETDRNDPDKNRWLMAFSDGLLVSLPLVVYGSLIYLAVYTSWQNIFTCILGFAIVRILTYFQNRKKSGLEGDV